MYNRLLFLFVIFLFLDCSEGQLLFHRGLGVKDQGGGGGKSESLRFWQCCLVSIEKDRKDTIPLSSHMLFLHFLYAEVQDKGCNGVFPVASDNDTNNGSYPCLDDTTFKKAVKDYPDRTTYGMMEHWCVSKVTDMSNTFESILCFNIDISAWDVSRVTTMAYMFSGAHSFNQPLNNWNVGAVTNMNDLFSYAGAFDQPLNNWNVSAVTSMRRMFHKARVFNQPLEQWDVSSVTDMFGMFAVMKKFNQPLNKWNVSAVTNMFKMFYDDIVFNQPLDKWDLSSVTSMNGIFYKAKKFDQDLCSWRDKIDKEIRYSLKYVFKGTSCVHEDDPTGGEWCQRCPVITPT